MIDRIIVRAERADPDDPGIVLPGTDRTRLTDSVETALKLGEGSVIVSEVKQVPVDGNGSLRTVTFDRVFSEHFACMRCELSFTEIEPRTFSFNSPHGACPSCDGAGGTKGIRPGTDFGWRSQHCRGGGAALARRKPRQR